MKRKSHNIKRFHYYRNPNVSFEPHSFKSRCSTSLPYFLKTEHFLWGENHSAGVIHVLYMSILKQTNQCQSELTLIEGFYYSSSFFRVIVQEVTILLLFSKQCQCFNYTTFYDEKLLAKRNWYLGSYSEIPPHQNQKLTLVYRLQTWSFS